MTIRVLGSLFILAGAPIAAQLALPTGAGPVDPATAANLGIGLQSICAPFLRDKASAGSLDAIAANAGYEKAAAASYGSVGQPIPGAPPAVAFHKASGSAADAPDVTVFLTTVPTACQLRVEGDAAAWSTYLGSMGRRHGKLIAAAEITSDTTYSHEVYSGGVPGLPRGYTLFVNRWVGAGKPKGGAYTIINVLSDA